MNIDAIRGDTLNIQIEIESDTVLDLTSNDVNITFSCKQSATAAPYIFQKDKTAVTTLGDNTFMLRIAPEDTNDIIPGYYNYDIELQVGDDIYTLALGRLHIEADITRPPVVLPEFPYPDLDNDGYITALDASTVITAVENIKAGEPSGLTTEQEDLADCNRDGFIDDTDASLLLSFYAGTAGGKYTNNQAGWTEFMTEHYIPQG